MPKKTIKVSLVLNNDEALILSSCMTLSGVADIRENMIAALESYVTILRAKKNGALIQAWYPTTDGRIEDI